MKVGHVEAAAISFTSSFSSIGQVPPLKLLVPHLRAVPHYTSEIGFHIGLMDIFLLRKI